MITPDKIMMHGSDWDGQNVIGWTATEKLDGWFVRWTGEELLTRSGCPLDAPRHVTQALPPGLEVDAELWPGAGQRDIMKGCLGWTVRDPRWRKVRVVAFDTPVLDSTYDKRRQLLKSALGDGGALVSVWGIASEKQLWRDLERTKGIGGEGLMLRAPFARYTPGRTTSMLKVKRLPD